MSTTRIRQCALILFVLIATPSLVVWAQTTPARRAATVIGAIPNISALSDTGTVSELTIRWRVAESATGEPIPVRDVRPLNQFELISRRSVTSGIVRERAPQLSTEHLVVIAVDAGGREVAWQHVKDPRIVRAETPGANLELSGQTLHRPVTELLVTVPDALSPAAIRVYDVQWNGTEFMLQELGEVAVVVR